MHVTQDTEQSEDGRARRRDTCYRLTVTAGMLAFLVGLALLFVASAPS
jgi:hypothetical protein